MAGVVHHEHSVAHGLVQVVHHARIAETGGGRYALVGVEIDAADEIVGVLALYLANHGFSVLHVDVVVAVVVEETDGVFPCSHALVAHVVDKLIHHSFGFGSRQHGDAAHADARLGGEQVGRCVVVHERVVFLHHVAVGVAERVVRLIAQQIVVGRQSAECRGDHAVVPHAVAEKKQVLRTVHRGGGVVVEHLHEPTDGRGIGSSGGKLIVDLVSADHHAADTVVGEVGIRQALCLRVKFSARWDNDDQVDVAECVEILILNLSHYGW